MNLDQIKSIEIDPSFNEEKYLNAAINCGQWIVDSQNKQNGLWDKYNYVDNFTPSYFTRVAGGSMRRYPSYKAHFQSI